MTSTHTLVQRLAFAISTLCLLSRSSALGDDGPTEITTLPARITSSGRYELGDHLTFAEASGAAVSIEADDVSLDLGSHMLRGIAGPESAAIGIRAFDRKRLSVTNGTISGFSFGIDIQSANRVDSRSTGHVISQINIDANWYFGIRLVGSDSIIDACHITSTGGSTRPRHTIPHGVRLVGERNVLRDCCIRDLHLKRFDEGRGEIVGVHFDAARDSRMENNMIVERVTDSDDVFPKDDRQERRFAVWVNGGPRKDTFLTVKDNRFAGFSVPLAFTPGTDGLVEGNTFIGASENPIRGTPASQLGKNTVNASASSLDCKTPK